MTNDELVFGGVAALFVWAVIRKPIASSGTPPSDKGTQTTASGGGPSDAVLQNHTQPPDNSGIWNWDGRQWTTQYVRDQGPDAAHNPTRPPDNSGNWTWNGTMWVQHTTPLDPLRDHSKPPDNSGMWTWNGTMWIKLSFDPDPFHDPSRPPDNSGNWIWNGTMWVAIDSGGGPPPPPKPCVPSDPAIIWHRRGMTPPAGVPADASWWVFADAVGPFPAHTNYGYGQAWGPGGVLYCPPSDWTG